MDQLDIWIIHKFLVKLFIQEVICIYHMLKWFLICYKFK